jgi:PKD repeat protein
VLRYTSDWSLIDTKTTDSNGRVLWSDINADTYKLEAYYNGEFWTDDSASVSSGSTTSKALQRNEPYAYDFKVYNNNTGQEVTGCSVDVGTPLRYEIRVRNSRTFDRTVRARLWVDRNQSSSYDFDSTSPSQTVTADGGTRTFVFNHTPSAAGTYYRSFEVQSYVKSYSKTDSWPWGTAVTVTNNHAPSLSNGYVNPTQGGTNTCFNYFVTYSDPDGDEPPTKTVHIDSGGGSNEGHVMTYVRGSYTSGAEYRFSTTLPLGSHTFYFHFNDGNGHDAVTGSSAGPTVENQPPTVSIASPSDGATVSGVTRIAVSGEDPEDGALRKVEYYIDGSLKNTDLFPVQRSPCSTWDWDTRLFYSNGPHTVKVKAYDASGASSQHQINITVRNTGSLDVTVKNQNGSLTSNAQVMRYAANGSYIDSKPTNASGMANWADIETGDYKLTASYNGELWVSDEVSVSRGPATSKTLQRVEPYAFDFKVYNANNNQDVTGLSVGVGTPLRYQVKVRNSSPVDRDVRVLLQADRDQASPYDFENTSSSQAVRANGGTKTFTFNNTPSSIGTYYRSFEIQTAIDNYTKTDSWAWGNAVSVSSNTARGTITITAVNQHGNIVSQGNVYVNDVLAGPLSSDGRYVVNNLGIGCYRVQVKDALGQSSNMQGVGITVENEAKAVTAIVNQTMLSNVDFPSCLVLNIGENKAIDVNIGMEACESGRLDAYLYNGPFLISSASVPIGYSGSFLKKLTLNLTAPQTVGNYQYTVKVVFDPDNATVGNTLMQSPLNFQVVKAQPGALIEWTKIIDGEGQQLDHELFKYQASSYRVQVKTLQPATVTWGDRPFQPLSGAVNTYFYTLTAEDFTWGQDVSIPGNITVNASTSSLNENKTLPPIGCRDTEIALTAYFTSEFFKLFDEASGREINLPQLILDNKDNMIQKIGQPDPFVILETITVNGERLQISARIGLDDPYTPTGRLGFYFNEIMFKWIGRSGGPHISFVNQIRFHKHGKLKGGISDNIPDLGDFWIRDLPDLEITPSPGGKITRVVVKGTSASFDSPVDPRIIELTPEDGGYLWPDTPENSVRNLAKFFETAKSYKVPEGSLSGKTGFGLYEAVLGNMPRWAKNVRVAGGVVFIGMAVYQVSDILWAAHGDKFEQIVDVGGMVLGCSVGAPVLGAVGAVVGALVCLPAGEICLPAFVLAGEFIGCGVGAVWVGEPVARYTYRMLVEGQEVDWADLKDQTYYWLTHDCDQINTNPEQYRCYREDGTSFIVTRVAKVGLDAYEGLSPDNFVAYDEAGGGLPDQQDVPIIPINESSFYTKTFKGNWVRVTKTGESSFRRVAEEPSPLSEIFYYSPNTIDLSGKAGQDVYFLVFLKNIRSVDDVYSLALDISNLPSGWTAQADSSVSINAGSGYAVLVTVHIPSGEQNNATGRVLFRATAQGDSSVTKNIELVTRVDNSLPVINLDNLQSGQTLSGVYDVYGTITDISPTALKVKIDGHEVGSQVPFTWNTADVLTSVSPSASPSKKPTEIYHTCSAVTSGSSGVAPVQSNDGSHVFELAATDLAGNSYATQASVIVDNPPVITITFPEDNSVSNSSVINVAGRISDPALASANSMVNGVVSPISLYSEGFDISVNLIPGLNNLKISATDNAGNASEKSIVVKLNSAPVFDTLPDITVSENDPIAFEIRATDVDNDALTYSVSNLPSGAEFNVETRAFTWTPDCGQSGVYQVDFSVSDGAITVSETVSITVNNVNQAPELAAIGNKTVNEDQVLAFTLSATDPDTTDTLTYSAANLPGGATFNATTRTFTWMPGFTQAGTYDNVTFSVSDGSLTDTETISITVNNVNRAPVLAPIGNKTANENQTLAFTLSATDQDGNPLTYSAANLPSGAAFNATTRIFNWTPSYTQSGTYPNITFTVSDGTLTDSETITITVNNSNRAPELAAIGNKTANEGSILQFTISAVDTDAADTLTYSAANLPGGATFNATTRTFTWMPGFTQAGTYANVTFTVSDGTLTDSETITITVNNVNHPPDLAAIGNKTVNENQTLAFTLSATDPDATDTLIYSATNLPIGATFNATTRTFSWKPDYTQAGAYSVTFTASDGLLTDSETITITVNNFNRAPELAAIGNKAVKEGSILQFTLSATDPDATDTLIYSATNLPIGATFNPLSRTFSWTPNYTQAGAHSVIFTVSDGSLTDSENITITVNNFNRAPELAAIGSKAVNENQALTFTLSAIDPDATDTLIYSATNLPIGATFNAATRTFSWTPNYTQAGAYSATFAVSDGALTDSETIAITVRNVNCPPVAKNITPFNGSSKAYQMVVFTATFSDIDGSMDISEPRILFNTTPATRNAALIRYSRVTNKLYVLNDSDTAWLGGYAPGANRTIKNSAVILDCSKTRVFSQGNDLIVTFSVAFRHKFKGTKNIYLRVQDASGVVNDFVNKGTWTIK